MIAQMSKIDLCILKEDLPRAVGLLHGMGVLHIEQTPLSKIMEQRGIARVFLSPQQENEKQSCAILTKEIGELLLSIKPFISSCLKAPLNIEPDLEKRPISELTDIVNRQMKPEFHSINEELAGIRSELGILPQYKEVLKSFLVSKKELKAHEGLDCIALIFSRRYENQMRFFKKHLEEKTKTQIEFYTAYLDEKKIAALVFYAPGIAKQIDEEIFKKGTVKLELPNKFLSQPLDETVKSIDTRLGQIPAEIERLNKALHDFVLKNISLLCNIKTVALNRLDELSVLNNLLQCEYTAVISGWLPAKDLGRLNHALEETIGKNFSVYDRTNSIKRSQDMPVLLENPKGIRPYELLLSLLPPPKYGTRDATGLVSLFFPLFFGLIVGDIGYGLIFLFISLFLKRSSKAVIGSIGSILFRASLSSIFFGILFGELFGNLGEHYFKLPHILFNRHESIIPFLILALSVGVVHIILGFLLGIIAAFRERHKKEQIEKLAILAGLVALFLLIASIVKILPSGFLPTSIVLLVVVTVLLIIVRGFLGPLELVSAVANILSYARLMALGLAGVMMAGIANRIGGLPENIFLGIILACILHALNLVLSVFSPTIQSLRLHYVEFFSKFYEPGGKRFLSFKRKEVEECIY